ncbi:MAG TPA: HNH endonuclease [Candidatus Deferrimicrobium sp.]|nr:HNH endonuclease [Candidatus Deferrimicrobium sp.]
MFGTTDLDIRLEAFRWLDDLRADEGDVLPRATLLTGFQYRGRRIGLMSPAQGIWKPAACELPLSLTTTVGGPYTDSFDKVTGRIRYSYRGTDPAHRDNRGLRTAMRDRIPLVYLHAVERSKYLAFYPAFVTADEPTSLRFWVQVDDVASVSPSLARAGHAIADNEPEARRAYITSTVRRRLHQATFRQRVLRAYREMCSLCRLRHTELLDAAHITPDMDDEGEPVVSNGLALCKLHHAAFDNFFFTVTPDYRIEVRPSILTESDGPMLIVGLQDINGRQIELPNRAALRPDVARLEKRLERFRAAS